MFGAIEGIDHQHRITGLSQAPPHLPKRRPQAIDIRPDQHARMAALCRMYEVGVTAAVGGPDIDLGFLHGERAGDRRQERHEPRAHREGAEFSA
jgi:hypothetical protein